MAKVKMKGVEFKDNNGLTVVFLPYEEYGNASSLEVLNELRKDCSKERGVSVNESPVECQMIYTYENCCKIGVGEVTWSRIEFMGNTLGGYGCYLMKVYDIIRNINFLKKIGRWEGSL